MSLLRSIISDSRSRIPKGVSVKSVSSRIDLNRFVKNEGVNNSNVPISNNLTQDNSTASRNTAVQHKKETPVLSKTDVMENDIPVSLSSKRKIFSPLPENSENSEKLKTPEKAGRGSLSLNYESDKYSNITAKQKYKKSPDVVDMKSENKEHVAGEIFNGVDNLTINNSKEIDKVNKSISVSPNTNMSKNNVNNSKLSSTQDNTASLEAFRVSDDLSTSDKKLPATKSETNKVDYISNKSAHAQLIEKDLEYGVKSSEFSENHTPDNSVVAEQVVSTNDWVEEGGPIRIAHKIQEDPQGFTSDLKQNIENTTEYNAVSQNPSQNNDDKIKAEYSHVITQQSQRDLISPTYEKSLPSHKEPEVKIGTVDVFIEAPRHSDNRSAVAATRPSPSLSSRYYLRRL